MRPWAIIPVLKKKKKKKRKKEYPKLGVVVHIYNPNYSGGRAGEF
jgi:hypothetical protein